MESSLFGRSSLRWAALLLIVTAHPPARAQAPDGRSNRVDYRIEAEVQDADRSLSGEEWVTWENKSGDRVDDLWFHLYLNAYSNNRTTHLTESRGRLRGHLLEEGWGWQRVTAVTVARPGEEPVDVTDTFRYRRPDDENPDDTSVFSVDLPWSVGTGEEIEIHVVWESLLPRVRRRTGVKGDFIFLAHWFPKLGVYEGGRGWNCHQFHMNTEFYSNYGHYDVKLDLPGKYEGKVGASGTQESASVEDGRYIVTFAAPSPTDRSRTDVHGRPLVVHGFAWTADPDYVVVDQDFKFKEWADRYEAETAIAERAFGRSRAELAGRDLVNMRLLIQPERVEQAERHLDATAAALYFYGLWWGAYPYEQVTVVDPAWGARAAGGMEYPTLFTCGTRMFTRPSMHSPESVTVHEAGHQFWYGLVGNNEFEAAWLDEGFNSYTDAEVLYRHYGPSLATTDYARYPLDGVRLVPIRASRPALRRLAGVDWQLPFDVGVAPLSLGGLVDAWRDQPWLTLSPQATDPRFNDRRGYLGCPSHDPIDTVAFHYANRNSYSTNSYPRPAVALRTLSGLVGNDKFLRGMRHYADEWRFRHPYPDDFFEAFIEGSGEDVSWYFEDVFRGTGTVDWAVDVTQERGRAKAGYFSGLDNEFELLMAEDLGSSVDWAAGDEPVEAEGSDEAVEGAEPAVEPTEEAAPEVPDGDSESEPVDQDSAGEGASEEDPDDDEEPATDEDSGGESNSDEAQELDVESESPEEPWQAEILLVRHGSVALPVTVEIVYEDDTRERLRWSREDQLARRWWKIERTGEKKVVSVRIDPDNDYFIDADRSNDAWFDDRDELAPLRWSERVFSQVGHYLHWMSAIGG